ncbi:RidA family protein [Parvibaculaceae bacterium PLY_AMNH_Bact1]|nr:RidA family protein [Parvibaculaceae bacterium PLY_AMNH_Bact1]
MSAQAATVERYTDPAMADANLPFSQAVRVGDMLYLSGQIGNIPGTLDLAPGGMEGQARQTMDNIEAVLNANGASFANVTKCLVMLADMSQWADFNKVYVTYFEPGQFPARSAFGANGLALGGALEVECEAHLGN